MADSTSLHIAVIGGGPGGYAAAFLAADLGMKVTLIDSEINPGGVCLYRGCIRQISSHVAKLIDESRHAKNWGIEYADPKIDLPVCVPGKKASSKTDRRPGQLSKQRKGRIHSGQSCIRKFEVRCASVAPTAARILSLSTASLSPADRGPRSFPASNSKPRA